MRLAIDSRKLLTKFRIDMTYPLSYVEVRVLTMSKMIMKKGNQKLLQLKIEESEIYVH